MIISRTPFRISFVGGGTDLRSFYSSEPGKVLSAAIDKYIYLVVKRQFGIVEYKYRVNWRKVELRNSIDEIEHPIVREALRMLKIDFPIEISTFADIPAETGLGSSSAFCVGLLHALFALKGQLVTKYQLASKAAELEVDILGRIMGKQDHFISSYGNLNVFTFHSNEKVTVEPVFYKSKTRKALEKNLIMFYTSLKRDASKVLDSQNKSTYSKFETLREMRDLVPTLRDVLISGKNLSRIGGILNRGWELKRSITTEISSSVIDEYYKKAIDAGALGGKLLGAGGGGFLLFYVEPQKRKKVMTSLKELYPLKVGIDESGTRITYYDQTNV